MDTLPARARVFVGTVTCAGLACLAALLVQTWSLALQDLAVAALLVGAFVGLESLRIRFAWRGVHATSALTEAGVFVGLVALPLGLATAALVAARLGRAIVTRQAPVKAAFNAAQAALAFGLAGLVAGALGSAGAPALVAAVVGTFAFSVGGEVLLSALFGAIERAPPLRAYRERFALENALSFAFGASFGAAALALYGMHPLAVVGVVPPLLLVADHARLRMRVEEAAGAPAAPP